MKVFILRIFEGLQAEAIDNEEVTPDNFANCLL